MAGFFVLYTGYINSNPITASFFIQYIERPDDIIIIDIFITPGLIFIPYQVKIKTLRLYGCPGGGRPHRISTDGRKRAVVIFGSGTQLVNQHAARIFPLKPKLPRSASTLTPGAVTENKFRWFCYISRRKSVPK
jgi:hypothetical protein